MSRLDRSRTIMRRWLTPVQDGWLDVGVATVFVVLYTAALLLSVDDLGYARDEGFYFHAARRYQAWFQLLWADSAAAFAVVDSYWNTNAEHPALIKSLFALSHGLLWDAGPRFAMEGTSFRFPAIVLSSVGVGLVYLWGSRASGRLAGVVAAVSLAAMPRFFYHAHLACFDAPVVTMWTLCAYCWWRSLQRGGWWWPLIVGVSFGLALNTKHNAWFLPIVCSLHAALALLPRASRGLQRKVLLRRSLASLVAMATIGPLLFVATWPWLWHDTLGRVQAYAKFHLLHVYYNMEFLGDNYWKPPMPRGYAFVMTAATVPVVTLACFVVGMVGRVRRDVLPIFSRAFASNTERSRIDGATTVLWLGAIGVQYAAWLLPTTPIFGGTKHWMTAYPFLVLFAGSGVLLAVRRARTSWLRVGHLDRLVAGSSALELAVAAAVLIAPVVETAHAHPWALSSYSPLVGGASGGANLGLNRGFWGYQTGAITSYLDGRVPDRGKVFIHDTAYSAWDMLQRDGRLRKDVRGVLDAAAADVAIYHHEKHMLGVEYQAWMLYGTQRPDHVAGIDGVPVIWTYFNER